jgi:hypothetical protein
MTSTTVAASQQFDVWRDLHGRVIACPVTKTFVDDRDAPYGYHTHEIRIIASSRRTALSAYREELRTAARQNKSTHHENKNP